MLQLPEPPDGKYWNILRSDDRSNALVTLVSYDDEGAIEVLGTGFVIYGHKDSAICVGASHSFQAAMRREMSRSPKRELHHLPDLQAGTAREFTAAGIFVMVVRDGQPFLCKIIGHNSLEGYDVVVFRVVEPNGIDVFRWKFELDFKVPSVGDKVAAIVNKIELKCNKPGETGLSQDLHIRRGYVTDVSWGMDKGSMLSGQSFIVRTTIPMEGGMSGSPMIWMDEKGKNCTSWGVVSSDRSIPDANNKFSVAGDSAASMLWPAMGLSLDIHVEGADRCYMLLGEMLKRNILSDKSNTVSVDSHGNAEKIEIRYRDEGSSPSQNFLLTTRGHQYLG